MTTANLADALPRLQALRAKTKRDVSVGLEVWIRDGWHEVEWVVYLVSRSKICHAATLEAALSQAEYEAGLVPTSGLPEVVLP